MIPLCIQQIFVAVGGITDYTKGYNTQYNGGGSYLVSFLVLERTE